jgi:hypothetical protein
MNSKFSENKRKHFVLNSVGLTSPIFCLTSTSFLPFSVSFFTVEDALEAPEALLDSEADTKWRIVKVPEHEISGGVTFNPVQAYL